MNFLKTLKRIFNKGKSIGLQVIELTESEALSMTRKELDSYITEMESIKDSISKEFYKEEDYKKGDYLITIKLGEQLELCTSNLITARNAIRYKLSDIKKGISQKERLRESKKLKELIKTHRLDLIT